jgi:hypothetical protein
MIDFKGHRIEKEIILLSESLNARSQRRADDQIRS